MVILRYKKLKSGNYSLYLDISSTDESGYSIRQSKYLTLYTQKNWFGKDKIDNIDRTTVFKAEEIRKQTELELSAKIKGVKARNTHQKPMRSFLAYLKEKTDRTGLLYHLNRYTRNKDVLFSDVTAEWLNGFKQYMQGIGLKTNSELSYFSALRAGWNKAMADEIVDFSPFAHYKLPKMQESEIGTLSVEDIQKLIDTPFKHNPNIRLAFLFSCFTGLRISDIYLLKWEEIVCRNDKYQLCLTPFKTSNTSGVKLNTPLSHAAVAILEQVKGERSGRVFTNLPCKSQTNTLLKWWAALAKVKANLHFHVGRHTYATLAVTYGIDIYVISKSLGHASVSTTSIYAKLVDEKKQEEIAKLPMLTS